MNINQSQSSKYLEEAELTLLAAEAVFNRAKDEHRQLWANVVKSCYDCMEQALSSALASRGEVIPKEHPAKGDAKRALVDCTFVLNKIKEYIK